MSELLLTPPANGLIVLTRFECASVLHMILITETKQGFQLMKYANNHWWKFDSWSKAFWLGFIHMATCTLVEILNLTILISSQTVKDILINFVALVVLQEFDGFFFRSLQRGHYFWPCP